VNKNNATASAAAALICGKQCSSNGTPDLYLDCQAIDTSMPMGRLVFQVIGAFGEFERNMIAKGCSLA
jgi:DNA invertase Pin-like site-specific DNA recombinase